MSDQLVSPAVPPAAPSPSFDRATAIAIAPRRDPTTARTVCYIQPVSESTVALWSAGRRLVAVAAVSAWPMDPEPAEPATPPAPSA